MPVDSGPEAPARLGRRKPSEDFAAFCEAEFERRGNSGEEFDESLYRTAMRMVLDRLIEMEREGRA